MLHGLLARVGLEKALSTSQARQVRLPPLSPRGEEPKKHRLSLPHPLAEPSEEKPKPRMEGSNNSGEASPKYGHGRGFSEPSLSQAQQIRHRHAAGVWRRGGGHAFKCMRHEGIRYGMSRGCFCPTLTSDFCLAPESSQPPRSSSKCPIPSQSLCHPNMSECT